MCDNECTSFFNLPCFVLFGCTTKLRNFFLILVLPLFVVIIIICGCCTGLFNVSCFIKFLGIISGIYIIILIM